MDHSETPQCCSRLHCGALATFILDDRRLISHRGGEPGKGKQRKCCTFAALKPLEGEWPTTMGTAIVAIPPALPEEIRGDNDVR
jgi:hypothetical protein